MAQQVADDRRAQSRWVGIVISFHDRLYVGGRGG